MSAGKLWLGDYHVGRHQLKLYYGFDQLQFACTYWYGDVDLLALSQRYGSEYMEKIFFHILAFEANKLLSLAPTQLDPGPHARHWTPAFDALWRKIGHKVWAQWRYQHQRPDYAVPQFTPSEPLAQIPPQPLEAGETPVLSFCGGGKDSLVSLNLLEAAGIPYATYAYAHSIYGPAAHQHQLIDKLIDTAQPVRRHRQWVFDDFVDAPVLSLHPELGVQHHLAAETPSSIFGVLPLILSHGYSYIALAHERSADQGNLLWEATGEDVNHQWGKSLEAEALLNGYLQTELLSGFTYFSLLKPLYDVVIFNCLRACPEAVAATHSCNLRKPWCGRCPKCAYVWLNYMAYLPPEQINAIFGENLFDLPENQLAYRQMLGLEAHTPFECIGQIPEAQLAFELCHRKGLSGQAMQTYLQEVTPPDWQAVLKQYTQVYSTQSRLPAALAPRLLPLMQAAADQARQRIQLSLQTES